jgi:hypothetical protein
MPSNRYLPTTWYDPRVEVRPSSIHGMGMVASQPVHEGEIVVRIGGTVMTEEEFQTYTSTVPRYNAVQIGEKIHLVDIPTALGGMNHSCDANLWMQDEVTLVARRDIVIGEELTQDYALYTTSPTWTIKPCRCGMPVCRQVITGNDWQRRDVQERYRGHFSPFLNERIRRFCEDG